MVDEPRKKRRYRKHREPRAVSPAASFHTALNAAERKLEKALAERAEMQDRFAVLNAEIPALQRTIAALKTQLGQAPKAVPSTGGTLVTLAPEQIAEMTKTEPDKPVIPPEIAAKLPAMDLTGMGSIPATTGEAPSQPAPDNDDFYLHPGDVLIEEEK